MVIFLTLGVVIGSIADHYLPEQGKILLVVGATILLIGGLGYFLRKRK